MKYGANGKMTFWVLGALTTALVAASCASTLPPGANPHDMSAEEHREHAAEERAKAQVHEERYNPSAGDEVAAGGPFGYGFGVSVYNPTGHHAEEAAEHRAHAKAHEAAAAALEQFEDEACKELPPKTRAVCPLFGQIDAAKNLSDGVAITPSSDVNRDALLAHMRCHLAYAATEGFEGMDACPLYVKGVTLEAGESDIILHAPDPASANALQSRTATHVE